MKSTSSIQLKDFFLENFQFLNEEEAALLAAHSKTLTYEPGESILEFEKYERQFFYIIEGLVRGFKYVEDWEEYNLFFAESSQSFLSPEKYFSKEKKLNTLVFKAVIETHVLSFDHDELLELASKYKGIFEFYQDCVKQMTNALYERVQLLVIENAEDRYLHLVKTRPTIIKYAHKKHLAQFLGITPNSFSRLMRKLKKEKKAK